jgi:hypothetical protein
MIMARPKQFSNAAEKQKAYRERKKAEIQSVDIAAALLQDVQEEIVTLLSLVSLLRAKGHKNFVIEHFSVNGRGLATWHSTNGYGGNISPVILRHMIRTGIVSLTRKEFSLSKYEFAEAKQCP